MKSQSKSNSKNLNNQNFNNSDRTNDNSLESLYSLLDELARENEALAVDATIIEGDTTDNFQPSTISTQTPSPETAFEKSERASANSISDDSSVEPKSLVHKSQQLHNLIEAKTIEKKIPSTKLSVNDLPQLESDSRDDLSNSTIPDENRDKDVLVDSQQWLVEKERQINELAATLDGLIPLVVELAKTDTNNSQEYILQAIVPVIDRVIQQRSSQDNQKMAAAIAHILPDAIRQEISNAPESIGKAIAPEIALSIKEQTMLHEGAIAKAMGSEMGKAIKTQIEMERDAMVDALYPVIGSTISKYMNEVVQSINEKIDSALSPVGIRRKIRAKIQGVSEAELILQEALPSNIRAIFLIQNNSGLVIRELQPSSEAVLESDLLAGMLTAIRSFANDCIASNSELDQIDYNNFQILFETAGYCYLAVVVEGEPIRQFRDRMRDVFSQIVLQHGDAIEQYQGDPDTISESIDLLLEKLVYESAKSNSSKPPQALRWTLVMLLCSAIIPWGIIKYRGSVANRIEEAVAVELDANPKLSVYHLTPEVAKGQLTLTGRVPTDYLKSLAADVSNQIATTEDLILNNQIVAVDVPPDPTVTAREVAQVTAAINRSKTVIETNYQNGTVTIDGLIFDETERQKLITTFKNIPGVENVVFIVERKLPSLDTRFYFPSGVSQLQLTADLAKIIEIERFLSGYSSIKLKIIGHSDRKGKTETNLELAKARANSVYQVLIDRGIEPNRLEVVASLEPPPQILRTSAPNTISGVTSSARQPLWLSRCVRFETFIAQKN